MKQTRILIILALLSLVLVGCSSTPAPNNNPYAPSNNNTDNQQELRTFTLQELAEFDGKDGRPGYVAVDGVVYDVTNVSAWSTGTHQGALTAGSDWSSEIDNSPHGRSVLNRLPIVGNLE